MDSLECEDSSNGRRIAGIKLAWLIDDRRGNEPGNSFRPLAKVYDGETITLANLGLRESGAPTQNIKYCEIGTWNERFTIETHLSCMTELLHAKKLGHRVKIHLGSLVISGGVDQLSVAAEGTHTLAR